MPWRTCRPRYPFLDFCSPLFSLKPRRVLCCQSSNERPNDRVGPRMLARSSDGLSSFQHDRNFFANEYIYINLFIKINK
jgi:hypothetical protein